MHTATVVRPPGWRPPAWDVEQPPAAPNRIANASLSTVLVLLAIGTGAAANWIVTHVVAKRSSNASDFIDDALTLNVLVYVVVAVLVVLFIHRTQFELVWHRGEPLKSVGFGIARGALMATLVSLAVWGASGQVQGDPRFRDLLSENNGVRILFMIVLVVIAAPLVEETLFRGLALESWRSIGVGALILSALAFAAWHLDGSAIRYYWVMGLVLGRAYIRRGLVGSIATHATFNAIVLALTIASISGSGHTFHVGSLQGHAPASWHVAQSKETGTGSALVMTGPSGSHIAIAAFPRTSASAGKTPAALAEEAMQSELADIPATTTRSEPDITDFGPGTGLHVTLQQGGLREDDYVFVTDTNAYVVGVVPASSTTAAHQIPGILASLAEG